MERKVGEVFNDGNNVLKVVEYGDCNGCYYLNSKICSKIECQWFLRKDSKNITFIKIGESKMNNKEELKRSLAEEEQRAKDSLANVEKMKKQLEELNKKEVEVSATGVYLNKISDNDYAYLGFDNEIFETRKFNQELETDLIRINNIFATRKQAEQEALRREGQEFIRRCAMLWNKGNDWRKQKNVRQFYVDFDTITNKLGIEYNIVYTGGAIYFDTMELAEKCIRELTDKYNEEQIKTIFGVI
jgi:N-acetylmuramoyl-L-alanine amidase CwlA